jgi:hypothetical protein
MTNRVNRRTVLGGVAGAAILAPLNPLAHASEAEDPVLPLYRRWATARIEWYRWADVPGNGNWDFPGSIAAEDEVDAAFWAMIDTTPTTLAGIAALIVVLWDIDGPGSMDGSSEYFEELQRPRNRLKTSIWRGATGQNGLPPYGRLEEAFDFLSRGRPVDV